jgi:hypothetical protein
MSGRARGLASEARNLAFGFVNMCPNQGGKGIGNRQDSRLCCVGFRWEVLDFRAFSAAMCRC